MQFDNYIFDLYGTLIDIHTDEEKKSLWQAMCRYLDNNFGVKYTPAVLRKRYLQICSEEEELLAKRLITVKGSSIKENCCEIRISWVWERLIWEKTDPGSKYGITEDLTEQMQALCTFFREKSRDRLLKYDGVDEVLQTLKKRGKKIFLLSNAQRAFTVKELSDCSLTDYFDDIFISSDCMVKKPDPLFMEKLLKKQSLDKSKCVMIGNDILSDAGVASGSGIRSIFLNTYSLSDRQIKEDIGTLGITDKDLMPVVVPDGDIRKILALTL